MSSFSNLTRRSFFAGSLGLVLATSRSSLALPPSGSPTIRAIQTAKKLRVGMCPGFAPFIVADPDCDPFSALMEQDHRPAPTLATDGRRVVGLDVDLAKLTAQSLGVTLEIILVSRFDDLFSGLGNDQFEAVMSGVTRTLSRAVSLAFSQPYLVSGQEVFVRDSRRFALLEHVDQPGVRVGAKSGTTGEIFARQSLSKTQFSSHTTSDELFAAIGSGALDAIVSDSLVGRDMLLRKKVPCPLSVVETRRVTTESIAIVAKQGDPDWAAFLSLLVREIRANGSFHQLAHRYNPWLRAER